MFWTRITSEVGLHNFRFFGIIDVSKLDCLYEMPFYWACFVEGIENMILDFISNLAVKKIYIISNFFSGVYSNFLKVVQSFSVGLDFWGLAVVFLVVTKVLTVWWVLWCSKFDVLANVFWQSWQTWVDGDALCLFWCFQRLSLRVKISSLWVQGYVSYFLWVMRWHFKASFRLNLAGHPSHPKDFSCVWYFRCLFKCCFKLKDLRHFS